MSRRGIKQIAAKEQNVIVEMREIKAGVGRLSWVESMSRSPTPSSKYSQCGPKIAKSLIQPAAQETLIPPRIRRIGASFVESFSSSLGFAKRLIEPHTATEARRRLRAS